MKLIRNITILVLVLMHLRLNAQNSDTLIRYFNENFEPCSKSKSSIQGRLVSSKDRWLLMAYNAEGKLIVKAWYKEMELRTKDGSYTLYYNNGNKANEGEYENNVKEGVWKFYHLNGSIKDSGMVLHGQMVSQWNCWHENGMLKYTASFQTPDSILAYKTKVTTTGKLNNQLPSFFLEGAWTSFHPDGKIDSKGFYKDNKKEGTWTFFRENGFLSSIEQYKSDKIISMECFDSLGNKTGAYCSLAAMPYPLLDRYLDLNTYILNNIQWPRELLDRESNGTVTGQYTISKTGEFKDFVIISSTHKLLSQEVERVFRTINSWVPGVSHNRNIDYIVKFSVPFLKTIDSVD